MFEEIEEESNGKGHKQWYGNQNRNESGHANCEIDRPEFGNSMAVAKLEVYEDSGRMMLDVYSDALQDEVTEQIPIENLDAWEEGNE